MKKLYIILYVFLNLTTFSQTFEKRIVTEHFEGVSDIISSADGYFFSLISFDVSNPWRYNSKIYKLDVNGDYVDSVEIVDEGYNYNMVRSLLLSNDTLFVISSAYNIDLWSEGSDASIMISKYSMELELIADTIYGYINEVIDNIEVDEDGNLIGAALDSESHVIAYKINPADLFIMARKKYSFSSSVVNGGPRITESKKNDQYLFNQGGALFSLDKNTLEFLDTLFFDSFADMFMSKKEFDFCNDSIFFLPFEGFSLNESNDEVNEDMVLLKMSETNEIATVIDTFWLYIADTSTFCATKNCVSFIDGERFYFGGMHNYNVESTLYNEQYRWFLLYKMDVSGNVIWRKYYGGECNYNLISVQATSDGGCIMSGNYFNFPEKEYPDIDAIIIKVDSLGNMINSSNIPMVMKNFIVYPNPAKEKIFIESDASIDKVEIFDVSGIKIKKDIVNSNNYQTNISNLKKGLYFIRIYSNDSFYVEKLIIN
ncbi:MAG: hypothetical protein A2W91_01510 [Bacteroidetes bacterium GWF2_38_335]|nr:MAG: hypothetical protein A2W91_01510 [Bacteroidetes bacterium GWF2_38_335]OFY78752.1 MAG: hypothetical protein A2281_19085 [Bacteroidetes bacterium RIFOXYA12_FULL_38_20]HBS85140.1 hypothetical protein [Bacteroidales bacterium]